MSKLIPRDSGHPFSLSVRSVLSWSVVAEYVCINRDETTGYIRPAKKNRPPCPDLALDPKWGNTATNVAVIKVPAGTTIYQGFVAPQGGIVGGGIQVYIPEVNPLWLRK